MSLKILKQTLLDRWKGITLVTLLFFVFMAYYSTIYPSTVAAGLTASSLNDVMKSPAIQLLLGKLMIDDSYESYLSIKAMVFIAWIACGFMAWLAAMFLSGEIDHKTIDLLLAQPVRRGRIVIERFAALVLVIILLMAAALAGTAVAVTAMGIQTSLPWIAVTMAYMGVLALAFGAISLCISACLSDGRRAALTSLGIIVIMYFMETVGSLVDLLGPIRYLSLFHYARYNEILMLKTVSFTDLGVLVVVAILFVALAIYAFRHRDINVA